MHKLDQQMETKELAQQSDDMSFLDHLEELRWVFIRSFIAIVVGCVIALSFKTILFDFILLGPLKETFVSNRLLCSLSEALCLGNIMADMNMQAIKTTEHFAAYMTTGFIAGFVLAFPFVFYQFWSFILPGLKSNEASKAKGMTLWISILFFFGIAFGYFVISPLSLKFFASFRVSDLVQNNFKLMSVVSLVLKCTVGAGVLFQLPMVVLLLSRIGLVGPQVLKKFRKHALVSVLVISAIITPPDPMSQILITVPLMLLYEISILISARVVRKRATV